MFNLDPIRFVYFIVAILVGLTIHECSHAFVAERLGDTRIRSLGRITLNPIKHLDPTGALMMLFAALAGFGIGWAKPVPVDGSKLRPNPKTGFAIVAAAGPASNLIMATLLVALVGFLVQQGVDFPSVALPAGGKLSTASLLDTLIGVNVSLALFNLIPIPPLDGFNVLVGLLPSRQAYSVGRLYQYGPALLLLLIFFGGSLLSVYFNWGNRLFSSYLAGPILSAFGLQ